MKLLLLLCVGALAQTFDSPAGKWKTIDENGEAKSVVEITDSGGAFSGKIVEIFPKPGKDPQPKCDKCKGEKKDQPILGMTILWDLKKSGDAWTGGEIMDPENGKTYSCKLKLEDSGQKLRVRGFLGISLLGRSQVWERQ